MEDEVVETYLFSVILAPRVASYFILEHMATHRRSSYVDCNWLKSAGQELL